MSKIILLENIHKDVASIFVRNGFSDVTEIRSALSGDALIDALADATAIGIRSGTHITAEVLTRLPKLRAIGCFCIGTNQVDLHNAAEAGIPVFNAPYSNTRSVAELVIAQAILLLRRIPEKNVRTHSGQWDKNAEGAHEARGKTLGIIGYGNIGAQIGILAESIGMRVRYYDVERKLPLGNAVPADSLKELLSESHVVTLHVPGGVSTENLLNRERLAQMKPSAVLINASRGGVVDIPALAQALCNNQLSGAALDVFPVEPGSRTEIFNSPLRGMENVILTPHIGGSTEEAQENIGLEVAEKLIRFLTNGTTHSAVNFPHLAHQEKQAANRILHMHRNEPGVIARFNRLLAEHGVNIVMQQLQTKGDIGYAMTDIDGPIDDILISRLVNDTATIRCDLL